MPLQNNLGFTSFGRPQDYMQFGAFGGSGGASLTPNIADFAAPAPDLISGGYDPAGLRSDYDAATEYGAADPYAIQTRDQSIKGPQFKKAVPKWKKKLGGALKAAAELGEAEKPIEHYKFRTPGLLSGRML